MDHEFAPKIIKIHKNKDNRGFFQEILKTSQVPEKIEQISISETYPGVIKAFHKHEHQWDYWYLISGNIEAKLVHEKHQIPLSYYLSGDDDVILVIPPYWYHGYKVLGNTPAKMLYMVSTEYNPDSPDEEKISPYSYGVTWDTENR